MDGMNRLHQISNNVNLLTINTLWYININKNKYKYT